MASPSRAMLLVALLLQTTCAFDLDLSSIVSGIANTLQSDLDTSSSAINNVINLFSTPRQPVDRGGLSCDGCDDTPNEKCCACKYKPKWEGKEENLLIEYISVHGKSIVVPVDDATNGTVYKIEVRNEVMGYIPSNICDWDSDKAVYSNYLQQMRDFQNFSDKIVKLDFTGNHIRQIVDLNCLPNLDTLQLGHNKLEHLRNDSFNKLTHLRVLNLEHNSIRTLDPSVLTNVNLHITHADLQSNELQEIDITNSLSLYPFCTIDYSDNAIKDFTNVHDYTLDTSQTYGPGYVSMQGNSITHFPDFNNLLNLDSILNLGQLLDFGFDFRNIPFECDGSMEPYLNIARQLPDSFWRNYMDVSCAGPLDMVGRIIKDVELEELVTDYPCYQNCECQDRPSSDYVYVDCYDKGITDMSKGELPNPLYCNNIHLNVSNNDIRIIGNISRLDKVTVLDVSNNDVVEITEEAAQQLVNLTHFDLTNNTNLKTIPEQFMYVNTCSIHLDDITLDCDCDSTWLSDWSNKHSCDGNDTKVQCMVPNHGLMAADAFHKDMLDCRPEDTFFTRLASVLAILMSILIITAAVTYQLRYEILITMLRVRRCKKNEVLPTFSYDAYLSFDEENTNVRTWVNTELIPELERCGYTNFLTYRDIDFGSVRDNVTIDVLTKTRNFLVVLSQSYFDQEGTCWTSHEWKYGWHMFKANKFKNIVLVNYDHRSSFDVDHPQVKAFLRVGGPVNFTNQGRDIIKQISVKLGPPLARTVTMNKAIANSKTKFDIAKLFLVDIEATEEYGEQKNEKLPTPLPNDIMHTYQSLESNNKAKFNCSNLKLLDIQMTENMFEFNLDGQPSEPEEEQFDKCVESKSLDDKSQRCTDNELVKEHPRPPVGPYMYHRTTHI